MKILMITRYFPPLEGIATARMAAWAKYLGQKGHEVTVLTTKKNSSLYQDFVIEVPYFDPVTFVGGDGFKQNVSKKPSKLIRFYRDRMNERMPGRTDPWILPAIQELKKLSDIDLIISSYGPPSAHIVGYFAKRQLGCLWFADFRDLWVDNHNYRGIWPFTLLENWLEKKICLNSDALITVSNGLCEVLKNKYPKKEVIVIPNGFDKESYRNAKSNYFEGKSTKFRLVYTGTLYERKQIVDPLFQVLKELLNTEEQFKERFELLFFGSPSNYLMEKIKQYDLHDIVFYRGLLSFHDIKDVQLSSDAFLQIHFQYEKYDGIVSGKVYEYLFAGKPILGVGIPLDSELGTLISRAKGGVLCQSAAEIKKNLLALVEGNYSHKSEQGFIDRYSRKAQAEEIIAVANEFSQRTMSSA